MVINVFHMPDDIFAIPSFMTGHQLREFVRTHRSRYIHVATVNTDKFEDAFYLTNSIYDHWSRNKCVKTQVPDCRSTSVGDLLSNGNSEMIVARFGFEPTT